MPVYGKWYLHKLISYKMLAFFLIENVFIITNPIDVHPNIY